MGKMQNNLWGMMIDAGWKAAERKYSKLTIENIKEHGLYDEIQNTYIKLGGLQDIFPIRFGGWDMEFDTVVVELDEQRHFNRYRNLTLESSIYKYLPRFPLEPYKQYCSNYEVQCLKAGGFGGYWTKDSCERHFGKPSDPKDLSRNGSPRWKQRAFYDYLKDICILTSNIPLVRISIWDIILMEGKNELVMNILKNNNPEGIKELQNLILKRTL